MEPKMLVFHLVLVLEWHDGE